MLEFDGLTKRYGTVIALDGCSFEVHPGRLVGFLGPNGSGKTTAMRAVFGLVQPESGEVRWNGERIDEVHRLRFGYMPEQRGLYPRMRAADQVAYFGRIHGMAKGDAERAATSWLERLGLGDRLHSRVEELSHGNQQRVQLAVSLVHGGDLLVLDEPFSGLDPLGVETMTEVVREEARRGAAVVFSSHQLDLVEDLCDDIAIIHQGRTVLTGALRDVRARSRYRYLHLAIRSRATGEGILWEPPIEGAEVIWRRHDEARIRIPADATPGALLAAAEEAGEVVFFRFEPPSLTDLFLEAVAA
jgi:ABC-2 type transport system ATP-binding protein